MLAATQSAGSALWGELQQQQAQRSAEQAEARARALQSEARSAQSEADQAQDRARTLKIDSDQAQSQASEARRGLQTMSAISEVQGEMTALRENIAPIFAGTTTESSAPAAFVNAEGQTTGTLINVSA